MSEMCTVIKFGLNSGCPGGLEGVKTPHSASLEGRGRAWCGQCSEDGGCGLDTLPRPTTAISKRIINHNNKHQQLQRPHWRMWPKPARIQLAQPTPVFSAEREGMGTGQAWVGAAGLRAQGTGRDVGPSCGSWGSLSSLTSHSSPALPPRSPQLQPLSPSPLLLYLRICRWNSNELSILWPPHFPTEGQCLPDAGSGRKQREKKRKEQKNAFQLFLFLPPTLFYFVCVCVGRTLHWLSPPRSPPPRFHPLGPALAPFMLHDSWNGSPGGSYRECIGSLGERKPPTSYTPDV